MEEKKFNFEEKMNELNKIVNSIQQNDLTLDESLKLYEEGKKIVATLEQALKEAESKVEKIIDSDKK